MKTKLLISAGLATVAVLGGLWLMNRQSSKEPQQPAAIQQTTAPAAETATVKPLAGPGEETPRPAVTPPPAPAVAAVDLSSSVDPAHAAEVTRALGELKKIYGQAGSLDWDAAKSLIAQRQKATQELVDRLARLGPGGARALAAGYTEADGTRAKLLLVHALGRLNDADATGVLQALLGRDESLSVRKEMVLALRQRPEAAAERALAGILSAEPDAQLRFASAQALSGRAGALPALVERMRQEPSLDVRRELVRSVGSMGSAAAMTALADLAQAPGELAVRQSAIQELGRSFGERALESLDRLLHDPDEAVRASAVKAVARVQTGAATPLLQRAAATDGSAAVRDAATAALASRGPGRGSAVQAQSKSRQVAKFLREMLQGVRPSVALGRDTTMLREILDKTAKRLGRDLRDQPDVEAELRLIIGKTYNELGLYAQAQTMTREAVCLRQAIFGPEHAAVAEALDSLGTVLYDQGDLPAAEAVARESLTMRRKLLGAEHPDVADALNTLGNVLQTRHDLAGAEACHREALAMRRKLLGNPHLNVAGSLNNLANVLIERGDAAGAEPLFREALATLRNQVSEGHPILATVSHNLAIVLSRNGDLNAAEAMHREVLAMRRKHLGNDHPDVAVSLNELAMLLAARGDLAEAEAMVREAVANKLLRREQWRFTTTINTLAIVLSKKGDLAAAEAKYREALEMRKKLLAADHPTVAESLNGLASLLAARGDLAGAEAALRETLSIRKKSQGEEHPDLIATLWPLAWVRRQQGDVAEAESLHREALSLSVQRGAYGVGVLMDSIHDLTDLLRVQGKLAQAEPLLLEAFNYLQNERAANAPFRRRLTDRLVKLYDDWGKADQAVEWRQKLR